MRMEYTIEARRLLLLAKRKAWAEGERMTVTPDDIFFAVQLERSRPRHQRISEGRKRAGSYLH